MELVYTFPESVSRLVTRERVVLGDVIVNPSAADFEVKIHNGLDVNAPTLVHIKDKTQDTKFMPFPFPRLFDQGMYFEIVANVTDYSVGIQYI